MKKRWTDIFMLTVLISSRQMKKQFDNNCVMEVETLPTYHVHGASPGSLFCCVTCTDTQLHCNYNQMTPWAALEKF